MCVLKPLPQNLVLDWDDPDLGILQVERRSNSKHWWCCRSSRKPCGHRWQATLRMRLYLKTGCPRCSHTGRRHPISDSLRSHWAEDFPIDEALPNTRYRWRCACGWESGATLWVRAKHGCPKCVLAAATARRRRLPIPECVRLDWAEDFPIDTAPRNRQRFRFVHRASQRGEVPCGHAWTTYLFSRLQPSKPTGCPRCGADLARTYHLTRPDPKREKLGEAAQMVLQGMLLSKVSRALNIPVHTLYQWRAAGLLPNKLARTPKARASTDYDDQA